MSFHLISEPAGTLIMGWKLVPGRNAHAAGIHVEADDAELPAVPADRDEIEPTSRWELQRKLDEVG